MTTDRFPQIEVIKKDEAQKKRLKRMLEIIIASSFILLLFFVGGTWVANKYLDKEIGILEKELNTFVDAGRQRPALRGDAQSGNAVWHYTAIEWVLEPRDRWDEKPPEHLPKTFLSRGSQLSRAGLRLISKGSKTIQRPAPKAWEATRKRFMPLRRHIQDGLQRERCDWNYPVNRLFDSKLDWVGVKSMAFQRFAMLMATASADQSPEQQAQIALEIIAFGQDYSRHNNPTAAFKSVLVKSTGYRVLEKALNRTLSTESLKSILKQLKRIGLIDGKRVFQCLELGHRAFLTRLRDQLSSGKKNALTEGWVDFKPYGLRVSSTMFLAWEWSFSQSIFADLKAYRKLPYSQRQARYEQLSRDLDQSWSVFGKVAVPMALRFLDFELPENTQQELLRTLIAAELHRRDHGKFPTKVEQLESYLDGEIPTDPYRDGNSPVSILNKKNTFFCYSYYNNQKDDQASRIKKLRARTKVSDGDLVVSLELP
jgi:hypothetical protein